MSFPTFSLSRQLRHRSAGITSLLVASVLAAAGCTAGGGSSGGSGKSGASSVLTLEAQPAPDGPFTRNFNPFSSLSTTADGESMNLIYEPLLLDNYATHKIMPWLATGYTWSHGGKTLTLTIRKGVKWSNGTPFSAQDVAYTLKLMVSNPALNTGGIPIANATANTSANSVVINFKRVAYIYLQGVANILPVPESIWSKVGNPLTYLNPDPVGTGPYTLSSFTAQTITLKANPHYWQANEPKIGTVQYQAFDSQSGVLAALETGGISWASLKLAAGVKPFTSRDPSHNKVVEERGAINVLLPNVSQYPLSLLPVRQAISDALNRTQISAVGENGVNPPAVSPVGLDPGSQETFIAPAYRSLRYKPTGDVAQARKVLTAAGFKPGPGGMFQTPKGTPLSLQILAPSSSAAFIRVAGLIKQELQPAGIGIDVRTESQSAVTAQEEQGHFQLVFYPANIDSVAQPYFFYQSIMDHADSAPVGTSTTIDEGRFDNATADADLRTFEVSKPGSSAQQKALYGLEQIFMKDVPAIPDFETVYRAEYSTSQFTGWPSQQSMYVSPEAYNNSAEDVLLHLTAAK